MGGQAAPPTTTRAALLLMLLQLVLGSHRGEASEGAMCQAFSFRFRRQRGHSGGD